MKKMKNEVHLEGYIFGHSLERRVTGEQSKNPNTPYIRGTVEVATDEAGLNVVPVKYTYVTEVTSTGKKSPAWEVLSEIVDGNVKLFQNEGTAATKVRIDSSMAINDFYNQNGELISAKEVNGGYIHFQTNALPDESARDKFNVDFLITGTNIKQDSNDKDYMEIKGYGFNFRNDLVPATLIIRIKDGIKYLENLDASPAEPKLMNLWGNINCTTVVHKSESEGESAFGEAYVQTSTFQLREWLVKGAAECGEFGDENVMTSDDLKNAISAREEHLADVKRRNDERQASQKNSNSVFNAANKSESPTAKKNYKF